MWPIPRAHEHSFWASGAVCCSRDSWWIFAQGKTVLEKLRVLCLLIFLTQQSESSYCPNPQVLTFFLVLCHRLLTPEHSQVHPASPSSLPVPSAPSSGLLSSHRRFSHWLCVGAWYSNQTICIYGDYGDHELLSPGNSCVLVGAFWRELLEPDKAHTSFLSKLSLPCLQPLAPLLPNPTYM